jgi:hypothetical protein
MYINRATRQLPVATGIIKKVRASRVVYDTAQTYFVRKA